MNVPMTSEWQLGCRIVPSPNYDPRPEGVTIDLIVLHSISLPPGQYGGRGVEQLFTNQLNPSEHPYYQSIASVKVSAHFFIRRTGEIVQFVPVSQRAWHAGLSDWQGRQRCNDFSIGIELEGDDETAFEAEQYASLKQLLTDLVLKYPIAAITSHAHIAPTRKTDPGPCFDWQQIEPLSSQVNVVP